MQTTANETAIIIGKIFYEERIRCGYISRSSLVESKQLKGKLTGEGLRKIEQGERLPRQENIELLGKVLGLSDSKIKEISTLAMSENIKRVTRRAGNVDVKLEIDGKAVRIVHLPPMQKVEEFAREVAEELVKMVDSYGVMEEDISHFRRYARSVILRHLSEAK